MRRRHSTVPLVGEMSQCPLYLYLVIHVKNSLEVSMEEAESFPAVALFRPYRTTANSTSRGVGVIFVPPLKALNVA